MNVNMFAYIKLGIYLYMAPPVETIFTYDLNQVYNYLKRPYFYQQIY